MKAKQLLEPYRRMRILITGGAGFLGTNFIRSLTHADRAGHTISMIDSTEKTNSMAASAGIPVYRVSIRNTEKIEAILRMVRPHVLIHLAALHFVPWCRKHPQQTVALNTHATLRLHEMAEQCGVEQFIFSSTAAVYGSKNEPCIETSEANPICVYGISKWLAEQAIQRTCNMAYTILRFFNLYGPNDSEHFLIPSIQNQLLQHPTRLILGGNLHNRRDYLHVSDAVEGIWAVLGNPTAFGSVYNVGTGVSVSGLELIALCEKILHLHINATQSPSKTRKKDMPLLCANHSKISNALGWKPTVSLEAGLRTILKQPI